MDALSLKGIRNLPSTLDFLHGPNLSSSILCWLHEDDQYGCQGNCDALHPLARHTLQTGPAIPLWHRGSFFFQLLFSATDKHPTPDSRTLLPSNLAFLLLLV